jgi:hypothetical protein
MTAVATAPDDAEPNPDASYQQGFDDGNRQATASAQLMGRLLRFLAAYSPSTVPMGQAYLDPVDDIADDDVTSARNLAIIAAFQAVRRLAEDA